MPKPLLATHFPLCLACLSLPLIVACTQVPELDKVVEPRLQRAAYPDLIPLDQVLLAAPPPAEASEDLEDELNARRERLQQKARDLNASPAFD